MDPYIVSRLRDRSVAIEGESADHDLAVCQKLPKRARVVKIYEVRLAAALVMSRTFSSFEVVVADLHPVASRSRKERGDGLSDLSCSDERDSSHSLISSGQAHVHVRLSETYS